MNSLYLCLFILINKCVFHISHATCGEKPTWNAEIQAHERRSIISWLLENVKTCEDSEVEYPGFDGWYHNLAKIEQGSVGQKLLRGWAGIRSDLSRSENWTKVWREIISNVKMCRNANNGLALFIGKQVASEILNTGDSICADSDGLNYLHYERNLASPYIDGGIIYGSNRSWATRHVSENGTIITHNAFFPDFEDIYTAALRTVWIKWHNIIAEELRKKCPKWSADKIYGEARKFTVAMQQRIYVYEWLPTWIGKNVKSYDRYDPLVDPQVEKLFQVATHLLQLIAEPHCVVKTCKSIHNVRSWRSDSQLIRFLMQDSCKTHEKYECVKSIKQYHRLPGINHARRVFSLNSYSGWKEFTAINKINNSTLIALLMTAVDFQQLDSMMGGTLESINGLGELFVQVIYDQFRRTRDGDRFWFENRQNNLFSSEEICKINKINFIDIILTVTDIPDGILGNQSAFQVYNEAQNVFLDFLQLNGSVISVKSENLHLVVKDITFYEVVLISVVLGYCLVISIILFILTFLKRIQRKWKKAKENQVVKELIQVKWEISHPLFVAYEYDGTKPKKRVVLVMDKQKKQIIVRFITGIIKRTIGFGDCSKDKIVVITVSNQPIVILKSPNNYDLILYFESVVLQDMFLKELSCFIAEAGKGISPELKWNVAKKQLLTKKHHQTLLEMFLRVAMAQAFEIEHSLEEILGVDTSIATEVVHTELTLAEFSESLRMNPDSEFLKTVFPLVDRDQKGFICFRAFLDFIILFANGTEEEKAHLLFKLYDIDGTALLPSKDFQAMLKSFLEIVGERCTDDIAQKLVKQSQVDHKDKLDFRDFKRVIAPYLKNLSRANLDSYKFVQNDHSYLSLTRQSFQAMFRSDNPPTFSPYISVIDQEQQQAVQVLEKEGTVLKALIYLGSYSTESFWVAFIALVISYVFVDKTIYFYDTINSTGINRYILAISKGAIYGIWLSYSVLFVTAGRNFSNHLAIMHVYKYLPLKNMETINYYAALMSLLFTIIHVVGYVHLSMSFMIQTADSTCNNTRKRGENINNIQFNWQNPVTLSGLLLGALLIPVCIFLEPRLRRLSKGAFYSRYTWNTLIIILLVIHGLLSEKSLLYSIPSGPIIFYLLDRCIGMRRRKINLPILKVEFLPADVMRLTLRRPKNFQYEVGQWVEIAIPQISPNEFYRYVLASAPSNLDLCIYVHPSDPYAYQLRTLAEVPRKEHAPAPIRVRLDGPFGDGLRKWRFYNVSIFIGGGSGVELFASVLKDIAYVLRSQTEIPCKKVYFIWTSKEQNGYEWIIDLIREVEDKDQTQLFSAHLFITELYENFNLRTILVNIFEKYYPKISGRSIFTSLKAVTHFKRPSIPKCLETIQSLHKTTKTVGVFSSGPISLMRVVSETCTQINVRGEQAFEPCFLKYN